MMITGYYDHFGYRIESDGREIYCAGNHQLESTAILDKGSHFALPLATIKRFCHQTAHEFGSERNEPVGAIERDEDESFAQLFHE